MRLWSALAVLPFFVAGLCSAEDENIGSYTVTQTGPSGGAWSLGKNDKPFLITTQAENMDAMTFRAGTVDQLQAVQGGPGNGWGSGSGFSGYQAQVFADFAPTSWLQVGLTMNYGTLGDPAVVNTPAPTGYVKAQFLQQSTAGINAAAAVNLKKIGFSRPTDPNANIGEVEAQLMVDKRIGKFLLSANGVYGHSFSAPDSDAELKLAAGYLLSKNLMVGVDSITRYDTSSDGGPKDGTRYSEFTGGAMATWKVGDFGLSGLAGVAAPMHTPKGVSGVGPAGMLQLTYAL